MQIQCQNCHRPFALSKEDIYAALEQVVNEDLKHYDAHCPHCRRVNRISRKQLERAAPGWTPEPQPSEAEKEEG